jgi:hypothetical protein
VTNEYLIESNHVNKILTSYIFQARNLDKSLIAVTACFQYVFPLLHVPHLTLILCFNGSLQLEELKNSHNVASATDTTDGEAPKDEP